MRHRRRATSPDRPGAHRSRRLAAGRIIPAHRSLVEELVAAGDAVAHADGFAGADRPVVVALGDSLIHTPPAGPSIVARLIEAYERTRVAAVVAVDAVAPELVSRYGIVTPAGGASATRRAIGSCGPV